VAEGAAQSVASIEQELRVDAPGDDFPVGDREVHAIDGVVAELDGEVFLRGDGAREDHHAAGVAVEAVHHRQRRVPSSEAPQQRANVQQRMVLVAGLVLDAQHSRRLVDHHHVAIVENDRTVGKRAGALPGSMGIDGHHRAGRHAGGGVGAARPIDGHAAIEAELLRLRPCDTGLLAHHRGQGRRHPLPGPLPREREDICPGPHTSGRRAISRTLARH